MPSSTTLRVELSRRIRTASPVDWREFTQLWMAFNAIYGGEPDSRERSRVITCIKNTFSEQSALSVLNSVVHSTDRILEIPPGDTRLNKTNPAFRAESQRDAAQYRNKDNSAVDRLSAVGGVLYQVRCNLIHGSKDPDDVRDRMLVTESLVILRALVPALEAELEI